MAEHELAPPRRNDAQKAIERHAWRDAYDLLRDADARGELTPEQLEQLGECAWWNGRLDECIDARERAFQGFLARGDARNAAVEALRVSFNYYGKLNKALEAAWFKRAQRLLADEPECIEHAHLVRREAAYAAGAGRLDEALELSERALDLATRFGDRDLMALSLHDLGRFRITKGEVEEGLSDLDEATLAAMHGEVGPYATAVIYCNVIEACRNLADFRRAGEWTDAAKRWCERQAIAGFPGQCRVDQAEVMKLRGSWAEAEQAARDASEELRDFRLPVAARAFYEVGEIRLRVGDYAGASEAFSQAAELGHTPEPGLALLKLAEGNVDGAATCIRRALDEKPWDRLARARLLPARVEIALAANDLPTAQESVEELRRIAETYGSDALRAHALAVQGAVELARGDAAAAVRAARAAWELWLDLDAPYEAGRARALLGEAYSALGDADAAVVHLEAAKRAFQQLGAAPDARRVSSLLAAAAPSPAARVVAKTFLFTDIASSTQLVEAIGDDAWTGVVRWHDDTLRSLFAGNRGTEVDHAGDGFFVAFDAIDDAVECAIAIQRKLAEHRHAHGFAPQVRIGIHSAAAAEAGDEYRGKGVHEAARVAALAEGGEILTTRDSVAEIADRLALSEVRAVSLKGISAPVEVVSVDWRQT